jgi:ABC-type oligopeptide transport system substrate-binding subunit
VSLKVLLWGILATASVTLAAAADEEPKRGGTLTYMIPADAPPSFDAHREETYATIHSAAPFYSTLIRADPYDPGKTEADQRRQDLHLQDPRRSQIHRRLAIDGGGCRGELE